MKKLLPFGLVALLTGCSLVAPYTVTFTNTPGSVVDPSTSTVDFVVSEPTLAYVSKVECEGAEPVELLPIVDEDEEASTLHKLALTAMEGMPSGASCEVTVTVFDPTTTETADSSIELTMNGIAAGEEGEMCGGIAGIQCAEGSTCDIPNPEVPDASGTCVKIEETEEEENTDEDQTEATEESSESTESSDEETSVEVQVDTSVDNSVESTETPSETNDSAESTDAAGTEEQGA